MFCHARLFSSDQLPLIDYSICSLFLLLFSPTVFRPCFRNRVVLSPHPIARKPLYDETMAALDPAARKKVLRVIAISLLLDLVSLGFASRKSPQHAHSADLLKPDFFYFHPPALPQASRVLPRSRGCDR